MILLFFFLMTEIAQADVFVVTSPDKSVYSISEADDAVIPSGYKKDIIKNKGIKDLTVSSGEERLYDFNGSKFVLNENKVKEKNKSENDLILTKQKRATDKQSVIEKLKVLNFSEDEIKIILK